MHFNDILTFWFHEIEPKQWWKKDKKFDDLLRCRFLNIHSLAIKSQLTSWQTCEKGRLAEIIVIDQFSRNIFRNKPEAFNSDHLALFLSKEILHLGHYQKFNKNEKIFAIMPFMHSEIIEDQIISLNLYSNLGIKENFRSALKHFNIIRKFGRFPHRNKILNRKSTDEELAFLKTPGSSF